MHTVFRRLLRVLVIVLAVSCAGFLLFRNRLDPAIWDLAQTQVKNATSDIINDSIDRQIKSGAIDYDRMVHFEKDLDGRITALKTNMGEMNRLKTETLSLLNDQILALDTSRIGIPVGSLILPEFFSGKGFSVPVHILAIRNSDASFSSNFVQAGINQTLQQIYMNVSVDVTVLVLGKTDSFTVDSQVVIAETVIVGQVPNTYLQTGGSYGTGTENQ